VGTEGRLLIDNAFLIGPDTRAVLQQGSEEEVEIEVPEGSAYSYEVAALTAAILEGAELPVSLNSSRWNVATLATFYASARQGRPLPVPEV
jgi:predicted dehydrogenase